MNKISQIVTRYQTSPADEKSAAETSLLEAYQEQFQRLAQKQANNNPDLGNAVEDLQQSYALSLIAFLRDFVGKPDTFENRFQTFLQSPQTAPSTNALLPLESLQDKWMASNKGLVPLPSWLYGSRSASTYPAPSYDADNEKLHDSALLRDCFRQAAEHTVSINKKGFPLPEKNSDQRRVVLYHALLTQGYAMDEDFLPEGFRKNFTGNLKSKQDIATYFDVTVSTIYSAIQGTPGCSIGCLEKFRRRVFRDPLVHDYTPELYDSALRRALEM